MCMRMISFAVVCSLLAGADLHIKQITGQAQIGHVEFHGTAAGAFDPDLFRGGSPHFLPDQQAPLLSPRLSGVFRNIYAPAVVELATGWQVFFGGWDGVPSGNDRIYSVLTPDFITFEKRRIEIEHGEFVHVCNVSAVRLPNGATRLMCTAFPVGRNLNKPVLFSSPSGDVWNGAPAPYAARRGDLVEMAGYPAFDTADMNGMNVLLHEDGFYRLYFGSFTDPGHVRRASSDDAMHFRYDGPCLASRHMVNDVKKFVVDDRPCYLMGLHGNSDRLWYALSNDGMRFEPERELAVHSGEADRFMVAVGWIVQGQRLLGFLYGAGPVASLDRNRIFARWLQKRLVFRDQQGRRYEAAKALGPDRQVLSLEGQNRLEGHLEVYGEDGKTLAKPISMKLVSGGVYVLRWRP